MKKRLVILGSIVLGAILIFTGCPTDGGGGNTNTAVTFSNLSADEPVTVTTAKLTLAFDKDIIGLAAGDIMITPNSTGTTKGMLTKAAGTGVYELTISGISAGGSITVRSTNLSFLKKADT
jgi:hypothetical protein